jgi:AraC family transcriptional regulator of adaptative response/methylated-DNA-[protein]-cysteine methyltransferase
MTSHDFELVQRAIASPELRQSPELDRSLQRWAGTDSQSFFALLTKQHARKLLADGANGPAGAAMDPELDVWCQTIASGREPRLGPLRFGKCQTPFGPALMVLSEHGICALRFGEENPKALLPWKNLEMNEDDAAAQENGARIFEGKPGAVPVHLLGTAFQIIVWQALLSVPSGTLTTYQKLAQQIGRPDATRAVASAVARNGIAYLVPCHRVIQTGGAFGEYRWGAPRKQAMIAWENVAADVRRRC